MSEQEPERVIERAREAILSNVKPTQAQIEAAARVIKMRCCRAADGRDLPPIEAKEIAEIALTMALAAR